MKGFSELGLETIELDLVGIRYLRAPQGSFPKKLDEYKYLSSLAFGLVDDSASNYHWISLVQEYQEPTQLVRHFRSYEQWDTHRLDVFHLLARASQSPMIFTVANSEKVRGQSATLKHQDTLSSFFNTTMDNPNRGPRSLFSVGGEIFQGTDGHFYDLEESVKLGSSAYGRQSGQLLGGASLRPGKGVNIRRLRVRAEPQRQYSYDFFKSFPSYLEEAIAQYCRRGATVILDSDDLSLLACLHNLIYPSRITNLSVPQFYYGYHSLGSLMNCLHLAIESGNSDVVWVHCHSTGDIDIAFLSKGSS
ncbi:hypothetical protein [Pseudobacteriovorax antillogorgiicola]|uniref:Uncharacterized protein n=1 Tax=Pseudobacteriovorax antillogorgiicola TaxID=1513793 RepID=A0A1Y6B7Z6_9BACT|nr:hypothetical protein [Pseudobacteriovorax antillogorgiicola]TCS59262.1 hypothetical protein EDD56_101167 [Pseudobacteriovorax antillogorgiicola]SME89936.1 hypothetical protein SAMN06296036_101319 [Pseudobacteriovorax antillogorgiicola]